MTRMTVLLSCAAALLAAAPAARAQDAAAGERVFAQCRACHQLGENARNVIGPQLNGLFGRRAGSVEGYSYSAANKASDITWEDANFRDYIKDPRGRMPGTKMAYAGLKEDQRISDLIAYLRQFDAAGKKSQPPS